MARFTETEIEQLKKDVSVERLIEAAGIVLQKSGKDKVGLCPFHDDHDPSLRVTPATNLWRCPSCGAGGDVIAWVVKFKGVSFRHAVELLWSDISSLAAGSSGEAPRRSLSEHSTVRSLPAPVEFDADDQALLNQTVDYYHQTLLTSQEALAYLAARGLLRTSLTSYSRSNCHHTNSIKFH